MIQNITDDRFHLNRLISDIWDGKKNLVFSRDRYLKRSALLNVSHISLESWRKLLKVNGITLLKYELPKESPILDSIAESVREVVPIDRELRKSRSDQSINDNR
jgi:hypothetical protein